MDGLHAWSPDHFQLVYVTSDAAAVNVHPLSGAGDRQLMSFSAVLGRGINPGEDDAFLGFSPDGAYFGFEQTFTGGGDHLVVWSRSGVVFTQPNALWGQLRDWPRHPARSEQVHVQHRHADGNTVEHRVRLGRLPETRASVSVG
jgi:hypothetical protein